MNLGPLWLSVQLATVTMLLLLVIATPFVLFYFLNMIFPAFMESKEH